MALLMAVGVIYKRRTITILFALATVAAAMLDLRSNMLELLYTYPGPVLGYSFMFGVIAYHWRKYIVLNKWLFGVSLVLSYALLLIDHTTFLVHPFLVYVMVYVGMLKLPKVQFLQRGDYSYGMYLHAYPIQQTLWMFFPIAREWYVNFALSVVISLGIAALSWHWIEKPALTLKRFVVGRPKPIASTTEP